MDSRRIQRAFYEILRGARQPDELFSHRGFLIGFFALAIAAVMLGRRVPESATAAALITYVWAAGYVITKPRMSLRKYLLRTAGAFALLLTLWLCLRRYIT